MATSSSDAGAGGTPDGRAILSPALGLCDSHCHLDAEHFPEGVDAVWERARRAGVVHAVVIGVGAERGGAEHAVALAENRPELSAAVGAHPHDARLLDDARLAELERLCRRPEVVAVGEVGLDHHYLHSPAPAQAAVFARMIELALAVGKPILVHTREAPEQTLALLAEGGARRVGGIIHCFSEDWAFAKRALDLDFDLSFSGVVSFPRATTVREVARQAPAERILIETDSPYLAPVPVRGKRNEPAFVAHVARALAELRGVTVGEIADVTRQNAARRLGIARLAG